MEYLLKASAVICIFYICFQLLLKRETFFNHNRWFLIIGLILALVFPLVIIPVYVSAETIVSPDIVFQVNEIANNNTTDVSTESTFQWTSLLPTIYIVGLSALFLQFIFQFGSLIWLLLKNPKNKEGTYTYVIVNHKISPFSFFKWIVFNPKNYTKDELELILMHEKVHVNQMHSLDILFSQLACVIFWFNPLIWLYRKEIQQNLEYIADYETQSISKDNKAYLHLLLKTSVKNTNIPLTNNFYNSQIKNRIIMLHKSKSHHKKQWRYLLVLPLLACMLMSMNTEKIYVDNSTKLENTNKKETVEFLVTKNTTDTELDRIKEDLKKEGLTVTFKRVKRNKDGEIRAIKIEAKSKNSSTNYQISSDDEAIKPINIVFDKENNSVSIGKGNTIHESHSYIIETEDGGKHKIHKTGKSNNVFVISKEKTNTKSGDTLYMVIDENSNGKTIKKSKTFEVISEDDKNVEVIIESDGNSEDEIIFINGKKIKTNSNNDVEVIVEDKNNKNVWVTKTDNEDEDYIIELNDDNNAIFISDKNGKKPLFIIDGKQVPKEKLKDLNPKQIESVTVLKDKSATEKYGDKGKNGAIVIKTKKN